MPSFLWIKGSLCPQGKTKLLRLLAKQKKDSHHHCHILFNNLETRVVIVVIFNGEACEIQKKFTSKLLSLLAKLIKDLHHHCHIHFNNLETSVVTVLKFHSKAGEI